MPDETPKSETQSARKPPSTSIDMDQILEFIRLSNERRSDEITLMAEHLAQNLAEQLSESRGRGERLDEERIRNYDVTRRQLAGPSDDEADTLGAGVIVRVAPNTLHVGRACDLLLRDAGQAVEVAFASADGTIVVKVDTSYVAGTGTLARSHHLEYISVTVPKGAITGPITVVTDTGILTTTFDVQVAAEGATDDLPNEVFMALPPRRGER
jgi:hypothetical protein